MGILNDFLSDVEDLDIFSYEDYKNSSLELKLRKIKLLNEYYKLKYDELPKLPVYIDIDGVTLDTMNLAKRLLYIQYGIDYDKRDRKNIEEQRIIANFFKSIDWNRLLKDTDEINRSIDFIKLINESSLYTPTMYSAVNSDKEKDEKIIYFAKRIPDVQLKFIQAHTPKICDDNSAVLIDDDNFNLVNWRGFPLHFDSQIPTDFPNINDLGELYYLFYVDSENPIRFTHKQGLYDDLVKLENPKTKKITWKKRT